MPSSVPGQVNVDTISSSTSSTQSSNDSNDAGNNLAAAAAQGAGEYRTGCFVSIVSNRSNVHPVNRQLHVARLIQAVVNSVPMYADVHVEINPRNGSEQASPQPMNESSQSQSTAQPATVEPMPLNGENIAAGTPINNGKCDDFCKLFFLSPRIDSIIEFLLKRVNNYRRFRS